MLSRYKAPKIVESQDTNLLKFCNIRINIERFTGKAGLEWVGFYRDNCGDVP